MLHSDHHAKLQLWTYRLLCLMGGLALPLSYFMFERANAELLDPLWLRLALAALPLGLLGISFVSEQVRKEISGLATVLIYVLIAWYAAVALLNGLPAEYAVAGMALMIAVAIVAGVDRARLHMLGFALGTVTVALLVIVAVVPEPGVDRMIFGGSVLASCTGLFAVAWVQRRLRLQLHASEERYRTVFERVAEGVVLVDADTLRLVTSNHAYREITGFSRQDVTSRRLYDIIDGRPDEIDVQVRRALKEGSVDLGECRHFRRDGSRVIVAIGISTIPDEHRDLLCLTVRDLTESNRVRAQVELARDQAQAMLELRNDFLNNMSHEMRTPLISLTGFLTIMEDEYDDIDRAEREAMVGSLRRSADRLSQTLNAVLDLAQMEAGHYEIVPKVVDVNIAARDAMQVAMPLGEEKGLKFEAETGDPARIQADPDALHRILTNLFSNAVKFTDEGTVSLRIEADSHRVMIHIEDTGPGIDPEFMPYLFGAFRQASTGLGRAHEGTGLGLTITKRLLDLMGGRIRVDSTPGEGTCITLAFARTWATPDGVFEPSMLGQHGAPAGDGGPENPTQQDGISIEPLAPRPRVLIVEDNDDTARLMGRMLHEDFDVDRAANAESAAEKARGAWYDLLLIDIHLGPGMDGATLLGRLRAMSAYAHVPAVAITTSSGSERPEHFLATGFDACLAKPFNKKKLVSAIETAQHTRMMAGT